MSIGDTWQIMLALITIILTIILERQRIQSYFQDNAKSINALRRILVGTVVFIFAGALNSTCALLIYPEILAFLFNQSSTMITENSFLSNLSFFINKHILLWIVIGAVFSFFSRINENSLPLTNRERLFSAFLGATTGLFLSTVTSSFTHLGMTMEIGVSRIIAYSLSGVLSGGLIGAILSNYLKETVRSIYYLK